MRYIEKLESPIVFKEAEHLYYSEHDNLDTMGNKELRKLFTKFKKKAKLKANEESKEFCLKNEQKNLCAYCEKRIESNQEDSHIEHIIPISVDSLLIFKYENLIISCNGTCDEDEKSCGHNKSNTKLPLSPTKNTDISEYFNFNKETGEMVPSSKNFLKAEHTIKILNLDNRRLNAQRLETKEIFEEHYETLIENNTQEKIFYQLGYVSFLNYYFSNNKKDK